MLESRFQPVLLLPDWLSLLVVLSVLVGLLAGVSRLHQQQRLSAEACRKFIHVGMGLVTLCFPWLFSSSTPVWLLGGLSTTLLIIARVYKPFKEKLGPALHGVGRSSWGEVYFPAAVALLFQWSHGDPLRYGIPILILTLADALAALVGVRYGRTRYSTSNGFKSLEGSLAFFIVAFLCTATALMAGSTVALPTDFPSVLGVAVVMGLLLMLLEAIAVVGLDNVVIPIASFLALERLFQLPEHLLLFRAVLLSGISVAVVLLHHRLGLKDTALIAVGLLLYGALLWGGPLWLVPLLLLLLRYSLTLPQRLAQLQPEREFGLRAVLTIGVGCGIWLWAASHSLNGKYFYPFCISVAAHSAIIGVSSQLAAQKIPNWPHPKLLAVALGTATLDSLLMVALPALWLGNYERAYWPILSGWIAPTPVFCIVRLVFHCLIGWILTTAAVMIFLQTQKQLQQYANSPVRWIQRGLLVFLLSATGLLVFWKVPS
ncbi:MAG: hypothetical protein SFZ03_09270 [Candidatus Melainabacteria bacterium]|nr:hypothetical protein [Candidatus Melainabacteria bacterium]